MKGSARIEERISHDDMKALSMEKVGGGVGGRGFCLATDSNRIKNSCSSPPWHRYLLVLVLELVHVCT